MNCKCGCGREVVTPTTGRPGEYHSASCRKRAQRQRERAVQMELLPGVTKLSEPVSGAPHLFAHRISRQKE